MNNGTVIAGRYILKELIGQGGMADVFLARDSILDRDVAVKILRSHLADDAIYVQRFAREASASATLSHKNIVKIYDVGEDNGNYYLVMEYVPGMTLKELIHKRGAVHIEEAIEIMRQLISGVAEAHRNGIIHRDLKPQNILITDSGILKIGDFGIAMVQSFAQVTESTTIMGSLHYLAPEIVRGEKATEQSDIYALGIIFYELLRGQVPFNDDAALNIALKHMREDMPSIREFNPTISQGIENVIIKATAKNVEDRFALATDMLYALEMAIKYPEQEKLVLETKVEDEPTIIFANDKQITAPKQTLSKEEKDKIQRRKKLKKYKYAAIGAASVLLFIVAFIAFHFIFGSSSFDMPDLSGLTIQEAKVILEEKGLILDENIQPEENSNKYNKGQIIKTSPSYGEKVEKGTKVVVTVSKGKEIKIEDYTGKKYETAAAMLEKLGFTVKVNYVQNENYSIGIVFDQSLAPGTIIDNTNSVLEITLTVSDGYSVLVDSVVGYDIQSAKKLLEYKNIKVQLEILPAPTDPEEIKQMKANVVIKQTHEQEEITSSDTIVTLYYYDKVVSLPPTPEIPNTPEDPDPEAPGDNGDSSQDRNHVGALSMGGFNHANG